MRRMEPLPPADPVPSGTSFSVSMEAGHVAYSCIVDNSPVLMAQSYVWVTSLTKLHGAAPSDLHVHVVDIDDRGYLAWLRESGVTVIPTQVFDPRNRYCNKLAQLETFAARDYAFVALMDCDTAWVGKTVPRPHGTVAARIVDAANPDEAVLGAVFAAAGLPAPQWAMPSFLRGPGHSRTDVNNCNGGIYIFDRAFLAELAPHWRRWARWCMDHSGLLGPYGVHADQVGFALAMRSLGKQVEPLLPTWNFPLNAEYKSLLPAIEPEILHYHKSLNSHCEISPIGVAPVDAAIERVNAVLREGFTARMPNSLFWNLRYSTDPKLGSGVGSRDDILAQKRALLGLALRPYERRPVLDVGCGDLEVARTLPLQEYIGLDVAKEAIALASAKRPDWRFLAGDPAEAVTSAPAAAVVCLDVLIHQTARADFDRLIDALVRLTGERLIVSGYDSRPSMTSAIVNFHEPLGAALRRRGVFSEVVPVARYRDVTVFVADKRETGPRIHPNDMAAADFNHAATLTPRPDLLRYLADLSRNCFGFFTRHFPRSLEYPWIAGKLEDSVAGKVAVDIGTGLCPVPLFLAERGAVVHCVDSHPLMRSPETRSQWNEWGFFDYSILHPRLRSHHVDVLDFQPTMPVDVVYSISVVEHMPRRVWEATLAAAARWLKPGGRLILTLDLIPGTDMLWNYSEGRVVEMPDVHGSRDIIGRVLRANGFDIAEEQVLRDIPQSRTDVLLLEGYKRASQRVLASTATTLDILDTIGKAMEPT